MPNSSRDRLVAQVEHRWREIRNAHEVDAAVIEAINTEAPEADTLVFCDTTKVPFVLSTCPRCLLFFGCEQEVDQLVDDLLNQGVNAFAYHRGIFDEERVQILAALRDSESEFRRDGKGLVLVCTDSVSRGLDIPSISHVVQAQFATNAVTFLHRCGRTGRAGRSGVITSIYLGGDRDLVAAIRSAVESNENLDSIFSRRRRFRKRIKKSLKMQTHY